MTTTELGPVLVVTPHPDDAEIGAGGAIAKWAREGRKVVLVVCTNGDKGTSDRAITPKDLAATRRKEQLDAAKVLGIATVEFLDYPDAGLAEGDEFLEKIVRLFRVHRPEIVATVDPNRKYVNHRDHRVTGRTVLDAVYPFARDHLTFPQHLAQGLEPHKVRQVYLWSSDDPDAYVDVTDTYEIKRDAIYCHASQMGERTPEREERTKQAFAQNGRKIGVPLAERYKLVELG